jgi:diaminopimelate decarboxylase
MILPMDLSPFAQILENRDGTLFIDGVSSNHLINEFGSPLYVISEMRIREKYNLLFNTLSKYYHKVRIYYSAKANTNLAILKILENEGSYIDTVSPGEVFLALKAGFTPDKIMFTGTNVRDDELKFLVKSGVTFNIDSISQITRLLKIDVPNLISVRINPELGAGHHAKVITAGKTSKFGIYEGNILKAYKIAKLAGVKNFGIHMHIGSGILKIEPFILAAEKLLSITNYIKERLGINFKFIDFGGGLGIPYKPDEKPLDIDLFANKILGLFKKKIHECGFDESWFFIEPGRYIVCDAGVLLSTVNTIKVTPQKKFVGIDAGFNTLVRPAMYNSYHPIIVANKLKKHETDIYDIVGPICESGDILGYDRKLPKINEGDLLAILNTGAYGFSMSSQYNSRPRCPEVIVRKGKYALTRKKETFKTLLKGQKHPPWFTRN